MKIELREYQSACVQAHWDYLATSSGNPLIVVPTGGGKSHIIAAVLQRAFAEVPHTRAIMLTHVKELIAQNYDKLIAHWQGFCPAGIYSAGMGRREAYDPITCAGIQSVFRKAKEIGHRDLCLIDEIHLLPKRGEGMYRAFLKDMLEINPAMRIIGYTATPYRLDGGWLHKGDGALMTDIAYEVPVFNLVEERFLSRLVAKRPAHPIDLSNVRTIKGEFDDGDTAKAATGEGMVKAAVDDMVTVAAENARKSWLVFCVTVDHAQDVLAELLTRNVRAEAVFGHTEKAVRDSIIERFKQGDFTALVNVGVLTTGFDCPRLDLIAVMRATQSAGLYVQILGRGMRLFPGKENCIILDYGGNVERHGPITCVRPKEKGGGTLCRACPKCDTYSPIAAKTCEECGYVFAAPNPAEPVQREVRHDTKASALDPMAEIRPVWLKVDSASYRLHRKAGSPDSLRVDYMCGLMFHSEWVCIEREGFARRKAERWWKLRDQDSINAPGTVEDALEWSKDLLVPSEILVARVGKYTKVQAYKFAGKMVSA